jgi:hypothetical protein
VTFPVHITVIISATLAGLAFRLHINPPYYWVAVPVIVLVRRDPISPQGAGVMEAFAFLLTKSQGASANEAVVLHHEHSPYPNLLEPNRRILRFARGYHAQPPPSSNKQETEETVDAGKGK